MTGDSKPGYILTCEDCGQKFKAHKRRNGEVYCGPCRTKITRKRIRDRARGIAAETNTGGELSSVAARAREAKMTYGQYVAAQRGGA